MKTLTVLDFALQVVNDIFYHHLAYFLLGVIICFCTLFFYLKIPRRYTRIVLSLTKIETRQKAIYDALASIIPEKLNINYREIDAMNDLDL